MNADVYALNEIIMPESVYHFNDLAPLPDPLLPSLKILTLTVTRKMVNPTIDAFLPFVVKSLGTSLFSVRTLSIADSGGSRITSDLVERKIKDGEMPALRVLLFQPRLRMSGLLAAVQEQHIVLNDTRGSDKFSLGYE